MGGLLSKREQALARLAEVTFDVLVVGGGINGAVSALALAAHGLSVAVVDRTDFGAGTSQESSNLVWGGFKYLENYEIPLVFELCRSRNRLAAAYPSRIAEVRFLATLDQSSPHPPWFAALGAHAYWGLGLFRTARPRLRSPARIAALEPVVDTDGARGGMEYSDCLLLDNDSRFVSEMVFGAAERGAAVANYVEVRSAEGCRTGWRVGLRDQRTGRELEASARVVVNAAGAHTEAVGRLTGAPTRHRVVLSKGIHLVVPQLTASGRVLAFYDDARRLFYVIPMGHRSVVGTTDTRVTGMPVRVEPGDRDFLLDQINKRLRLPAPLTSEDVIAERCGARTLVLGERERVGDRDWTELSRRHAVEVDADRAVVSVLGGKLSDCLNVGREVVDAVRACGLGPGRVRGRWFGEPAPAERAAFRERALRLGLGRPPRFDRAPSLADLLWRRYGRRATAVLARIEQDRRLGEPFLAVADFCRAEVEVAGEAEWIVTMDDFLRRRTQLAQLNRPEDLRADPGVEEAGRLLLPAAEVDAWMRAYV